MREESREAPEQLEWGLTSPEATRAVPEVPVLRREHLPQLNKIQEVLPPGEMRPISAEASRGELHLTSGTSKRSFTPLLQLKKVPDIPVYTREEARWALPHPEEPRFRLVAGGEFPFPA